MGSKRITNYKRQGSTNKINRKIRIFFYSIGDKKEK